MVKYKPLNKDFYKRVAQLEVIAQDSMTRLNVFYEKLIPYRSNWIDSRGSYLNGWWFGKRFLGFRYQAPGDKIKEHGPELSLFAKGWGLTKVFNN